VASVAQPFPCDCTGRSDQSSAACQRIMIPRQQRKRLKSIAELGIPFQRLAIAHELDPDGPVQVVTAPMRC
jgi:hypothetical protein